MIQLQLLKLYLQMKSVTSYILSHCKLKGQELYFVGILENMIFPSFSENLMDMLTVVLPLTLGPLLLRTLS